MDYCSGSPMENYSGVDTMDWYDDNGAGYIFGLAGNAALDREVAEISDHLRFWHAWSNEPKMRCYSSFEYWTSPEKVEGFSDTLIESGEHDEQVQGRQTTSLRRGLQAGSSPDADEQRPDGGPDRRRSWDRAFDADQVEIEFCGGRSAGRPA
jgi:hypothetical protein